MTITTLPSGKTIATIPGDTHIGKWAIEAGRLDHDQNTLPLLRPYIPEGGTVIDVGAYIGDHTVFYASCTGDMGNVFAFEPNPEAFECLRYNTADIACVSAYNVGASDSIHTIGISPSSNGGASHAIPEGEVPCIPIDELHIERCDFIKLDCEGMEPRAMAGMAKTVARCRPVMLIEVNEAALLRQGFSPEHIFRHLREWGYICRNIYATQPMTGAQFDILCIPDATTR